MKIYFDKTNIGQSVNAVAQQHRLSYARAFDYRYHTHTNLSFDLTQLYMDIYLYPTTTITTPWILTSHWKAKADAYVLYRKPNIIHRLYNIITNGDGSFNSIRQGLVPQLIVPALPPRVYNTLIVSATDDLGTLSPNEYILIRFDTKKTTDPVQIGILGLYEEVTIPLTENANKKIKETHKGTITRSGMYIPSASGTSLREYQSSLPLLTAQEQQKLQDLLFFNGSKPVFVYFEEGEFETGVMKAIVAIKSFEMKGTHYLGKITIREVL